MKGSKPVRVVLDAMGGDNAPHAVVKGAILALEQAKAEQLNLTLTLTGPRELVESILKAEVPSYGKLQNLELVDAKEYIRMDDVPSAAIRSKKDNSLVKGLSIVKEEGDAFVYAGNTGALLEAAVITLGRLPRVKRPALLTIWPVTPTGKGLIFLDSGANSEAKPEYINQFAVLGTVFYQVFHGTSELPSIGLLNIGSESIKGNSLYQEAFKLLKDNPYINFIGNVEPDALFSGEVDVVVCDGFTGNMVLKTAEATAKFAINMLKSAVRSSVLSLIGGFLIKPSLSKLRSKVDYSLQGGALLIGLREICVKTHGRADPIAIKNAIMFAYKLKIGGIQEKLKESIESLENYSNTKLSSNSKDNRQDFRSVPVSETI